MSHAAVVENKQLGQALALVTLQQGLWHETKIKTNSGEDWLQEAAKASVWSGLYRKRARAKSGGNAGLRKAWKTGDKAAGLPPFPQPLEITP